MTAPPAPPKPSPPPRGFDPELHHLRALATNAAWDAAVRRHYEAQTPPYSRSLTPDELRACHQDAHEAGR